MDHAVNGYLFNYINFAILSTDELTYIMHGILLALSHLQDHQIVHRDVKPANIRECFVRPRDASVADRHRYCDPCKFQRVCGEMWHTTPLLFIVQTPAKV